ncbi:alpha/beta hydrolase [Pseudonocardia sp. GCM10023141]|uniref:alpha/beta hydrolase n=1 Tax=Pseudonocardia sp. GCM10023141 TaxID=3252653 RepID=UPI0036143DFB
MSTRTEFRFEGRDGLRITGYRWEPDGPPRAVVQLTHGVGDHLRRYEHLAQSLTAAGSSSTATTAAATGRPSPRLPNPASSVPTAGPAPSRTST